MSEVLSMPFPVEIFRAWRFCSNDSNRYRTHCVRVSFRDRVIEACSGTIAVRQSFYAPVNFAAIEDVFLYSEDIKAAFEVFGRQRNVELVFDGQKWSCRHEQLSFDLRTDKGRWPNFETLLSQKPIKYCRFDVSLNLLKLLAESFAEDGNTCLELMVGLDGSSKAIANLHGGTVRAALALMSSDLRGPSICDDSPSFRPVVNLPPKTELKWAGDYKS